MANYVILKKLRDVDDVKQWIGEYIGVGESDEEMLESEYEEKHGLTEAQITDVLDDLGYRMMSDMIGKWTYTEEGMNACGMPETPNKKDFTLDIVPVLVIVHGRKYVENVPVYEFRGSGVGLIAEEVWEGLW